MNQAAILIIGGTGRGKTSKVKEFLKKVPKENIRINDVNNEYQEFVTQPFEPDLKKFSEKTTHLKNAVIVYEEATIYISNRGSDEKLRTVLVKKRHDNNTIFLVFHSLRSVPRYVYDLCTHVILFKTNDNIDIVETNFRGEGIIDVFKRVKENKDFHHFELFDIYNN